MADASSIVTTYLYDRNTGDVSIVGQLPDGTIPNDDTFGVVAGYVVPNDISADGNYIVFQSMANNLVANDSNDSVDVFRQRIR